MDRISLSRLSKISGIALRKLRYCIDHEMVPEHHWHQHEYETGKPRNLPVGAAVMLLCTAKLLDAGVRRDAIQWLFQMAYQVPKAGRNPLNMSLIDAAVMAGGRLEILAGDASHVRIVTKLADTGWIRTTPQRLGEVEDTFDPIVTISVDAEKLGALLLED